MARPNYSHSKRQRELVKKQKREEKLAKKLEKKNADPNAVSDDSVENLENLPPAGAPDPDA
ncbi:MAG: hypothetical protein U0529_06595 [Thermoanaerobaculia bacterium]